MFLRMEKHFLLLGNALYFFLNRIKWKNGEVIKSESSNWRRNIVNERGKFLNFFPKAKTLIHRAGHPIRFGLMDGKWGKFFPFSLSRFYKFIGVTYLAASNGKQINYSNIAGLDIGLKAIQFLAVLAVLTLGFQCINGLCPAIG